MIGALKELITSAQTHNSQTPTPPTTPPTNHHQHIDHHPDNNSSSNSTMARPSSTQQRKSIWGAALGSAAPAAVPRGFPVTAGGAAAAQMAKARRRPTFVDTANLQQAAAEQVTSPTATSATACEAELQATVVATLMPAAAGQPSPVGHSRWDSVNRTYKDALR